jgi:hypothetical protein
LTVYRQDETSTICRSLIYQAFHRHFGRAITQEGDPSGMVGLADGGDDLDAALRASTAPVGSFCGAGGLVLPKPSAGGATGFLRHVYLVGSL